MSPPSPTGSEYWKLFRPAACSIGLKAPTKDLVLEEVVGLLLKSGQITEDLGATALRSLLERERNASTGIGLGVAMPHVVLRGLDKAAVSLCVHRAGVPWEALDGAPVRIVFTVLRPDRPGERHDPGRHLEFMRWVSRVGRDQDFRRFAVEAGTKTELVALLREQAVL